MKFYRVIYKSIYLEGGEDIVEVTEFLDEQLAKNYLKREIQLLKQDIEGDDLGNYHIDESENSYERYLDGRALEDNVSIWLEEAKFSDEIELKKENEIERENNDYEKE